MAKRILIADDSVTIQKAFAMTFAGADDVTLTAARSADEGLAMAQKAHPDLIIADAVMPGRSGYDLCASVRTDPTLRSVPVYILVSTQQPYDEAKGQRAGATGHLSKPWDTTAIVEKVRQALDSGGGAVSAPAPRVPSQRVGASLPTAAIEDDEYGEISIDSSRDTDQRARVATPAPPPAEEPRPRFLTPRPPVDSRPRMVTPPPPSTLPPGTMRPSLIPGMRPGTLPPSRPGTLPVRPTGTMPPSVAAPPRPVAAPVGRTMIGLPAAGVPIPGMRPGGPAPAAPAPPARAPAAPMPPSAPVRPASGPVAPLATRGPALVSHAPVAPQPAYAPVVGSAIEQKLAAFASKGPEYEAIAKLSREIIEQIAWEIVPDLAEAIIRAEVEKRGRV